MGWLAPGLSPDPTDHRHPPPLQGEIGFTYVSLDLEGYRTGSMNEAIKKTG